MLSRVLAGARVLSYGHDMSPEVRTMAHRSIGAAIYTKDSKAVD